MTWRRSVRATTWLARILAVAFVACGGLTVAGPLSSAAGRPGTPSTGVQSVPWAPLAVGSVGVVDAFAGTAGSGGTSTPHRSDVASAPRSWALPACSDGSAFRDAAVGVKGARSAAASSRAPPLTT